MRKKPLVKIADSLGEFTKEKHAEKEKLLAAR